jgi:mannose-1-phosphate guanylyltransferase
MLANYYAVIMAGGGGTRLWPLSRKARPKQMLRLLEERSLFQTSVQRLDGVFPPDRIYVVTVEEQAAELQQQCPQIPLENYLLEPMPRGTASVIGLAAVALKNRDPQAVMAVLTSDHYIGNEPGFRDLLATAYDVAQENYLVTLGISPTFAATGYGYIQRGDMLGKYREYEVYRALRFKEKPADKQAQLMLAAGDHSWNSGMFVWKVDRILDANARPYPGAVRDLKRME